MGAQAEATAAIQARGYGAGGEDADKQMGLKGLGRQTRVVPPHGSDRETRPRFKLGIQGGREEHQVCLGEC